MTSTDSRNAATGNGVEMPSSRKLVPPTPRPRIALPSQSSSKVAMVEAGTAGCRE